MSELRVWKMQEDFSDDFCLRISDCRPDGKANPFEVRTPEEWRMIYEYLHGHFSPAEKQSKPERYEVIEYALDHHLVRRLSDGKEFRAELHGSGILRGRHPDSLIGKTLEISELMPIVHAAIGVEMVRGSGRQWVKTFNPIFHESVRLGQKRQTIRPLSKRTPEVGDTISCRAWTGKPYRSKQETLICGRIVEVSGVIIEFRDGYRLWIGGYEIEDPQQKRAFARADGFDNWQDMHAWFDGQHGLPFRGTLIRWEPIS